MPFIGLVHFMIAIGFVLHANRTGRPQVWTYILLFLPLLGSVAYVLFELLPELANTRRARRVATDLRGVVDPHRDWHRLREQAEATGSVEAMCKLAEECERKGMWDDAVGLYRKSAHGMYADDPDIARGLARALLGSGDPAAALATLDRLRAAHPEYENQDAHLTYARALEAQGRLQEAAGEYRTLIRYFVGQEARARYGLLLQKLGQMLMARQVFEEVVRAGKARNAILSDDDREWIRVAQKNL